MGDRTGGTKSIEYSDDEKQLKHEFDAGFLSGDVPIGNPDALDLEDEDSHIFTSEDSGSSCSVGGEAQLSGLAASLQVLSESLLTMEQAEMEIFKARETIRLEDEKRRLESEAAMTQMLLQCQLQIASFLSTRQILNRKRKRVQDDEPSSSPSERRRALMLSLIQLNMITF